MASDRTDFYSFADANGLRDDDAQKAVDEVNARVVAEGLEVVRISFVDPHGILRGKTITADGLDSAFRNGITMPSSLLLKDTSNATVFPVWSEDAGFGAGRMTGAEDIVMIPDPGSFKVLPWSPHTGWMLADLYHSDGAPVSISTRGILKDAVSRLDAAGYTFTAGLELEFHVLRITNSRLEYSDGGMPPSVPDTQLLTHGFRYLSEDSYDALEDVFDDLRRAAQALGLPMRSMEVEFGPSQCEITLQPANGIAQADNAILFRSMAKQVCRRKGLHATFMCRPRFEGAMASGWHLHQSLSDKKTGENVFIPNKGETISPLCGHWIAGLLAHAEESCILTTPTVNGYKRYRPFVMAPDRIQWGHDNRGAMLRALAAPGNPASRVENRVGEPAANPYLYLASQILSGLDGLEKQLTPAAPVEKPYDSDASTLPRSLGDALKAFTGGNFYRECLGESFVNYIKILKSAEWARYQSAVSEWEEREYFSIF
ncbi:glutamine synthetase family protein [Hwanghaeella sp.]|uniref:glutamine synthetase family protein n=1 Tax=Hwanghaeella sp. TaxID=2605943 RepID=UPI003CCB9CA3